MKVADRRGIAGYGNPIQALQLQPLETIILLSRILEVWVNMSHPSYPVERINLNNLLKFNLFFSHLEFGLPAGISLVSSHCLCVHVWRIYPLNPFKYPLVSIIHFQLHIWVLSREWTVKQKYVRHPFPQSCSPTLHIDLVCPENLWNDGTVLLHFRMSELGKPKAHGHW